MKPEELLVSRLIQKNYHISCAESCTGGLLCGRLVNVADASRVISCSFITYSAEAKIKYAGVSGSVIEQYGIVSEEVAFQMAAGVAREAGCEIGVGITGFAGPSGGTKEKPTGTVCFGFSILGAVTTATGYFPNLSRNEVREEAVQFAIRTLLQLLK